MDTLTPIGVSEHTAFFEIDRKTHKVDSRNYHPTKTKKSQILLAGSQRKNSNNLLRLKRKDFGLSKRWPMFTIRRDGKIFQHFDPHYYSDFMDNKEIDKKIISVVLENMGMVYYDYEKNEYINWINESCGEDVVFEKVWKNQRYWESYTEEQFRACVNLCIHLCRTYGIKQDCLGHYVFQEETINFKGIITRSNYNSDFSDLNPSFDFKRFLKELNIFE
jgi:hypothetical protein